MAFKVTVGLKAFENSNVSDMSLLCITVQLYKYFNLTLFSSASLASASKLGIAFLFIKEMKQVLSGSTLLAIRPCKIKLLATRNSVFQ